MGALERAAAGAMNSSKGMQESGGSQSAISDIYRRVFRKTVAESSSPSTMQGCFVFPAEKTIYASLGEEIDLVAILALENKSWTQERQWSGDRKIGGKTPRQTTREALLASNWHCEIIGRLYRLFEIDTE